MQGSLSGRNDLRLQAGHDGTMLTGILLTDLYQLTMLKGYHTHGMDDVAVFEFFARRLPQRRNFLVAAGLEQALGFLEQARFTPEELAFLRRDPRLDDGFVAWLAGFRFTGDVDAVPEGTLVFADEPILRVAAPLPQAQLVESRLINILHYQTLIASKAARMVLMAPGKTLVDFGFRRAHGAEAGLFAARAAYLAGFAGSATVEADRCYGVPAFGTMAHSYIQAHARERDAFRSFAEAQPTNVVLLIDTYDTIAGARAVAALAPELAASGIQVRAVRLDSGDLGALAHEVRGILDAAGLQAIDIFASSSIDEYALERLEADAAPIGGYGIGTRLTTSADAPYLDCAYKLQEYAGLARRKRSAGKATWPGRKQVFRRHGDDGSLQGDVLTVEGDRQEGEALLRPVMRGGRRLAAAEPLVAIRARCAEGLERLPPPLRWLAPAEPPYPVVVAPALRQLADAVDARMAKADPGP